MTQLTHARLIDWQVIQQAEFDDDDDRRQQQIGDASFKFEPGGGLSISFGNRFGLICLLL
jgi:hypothetical protein